MTDAELYALGRRLLDEHGLHDWDFLIGNARNQFGVCVYGMKRIRISRVVAALNPGMVEDTILHEIAHALAGHPAGHGPEWRAVARSLGCNAERLHQGMVPEPAWRGTCRNCGTVVARRNRLSKSTQNTACGRCCREHNDGLWDVRFTLEWVRA